MDSLDVLAGVATLFLVAYLTWHFLTYGISTKGLIIYPFVGAIPEIAAHAHDFSRYVTPMLAKSKNMTVRADTPGVKWIVTANPQHIQYLLKDNFENFAKGETFHLMLEELLGDGIFNTDGETWKLQRKIASYEFSANSLRNLLLVTIHDEISQRLVPILDLAADSGGRIDMQDILLRFGFDNICRVGFGYDPAVLVPDFPSLPFLQSFDRAVHSCTLRFMVPGWYWKVMRFLGLGSEKSLKEDVEVLDTLTDNIIKKRRADLATGLPDAAHDQTGSLLRHSDILSRMIALGEKDHGQLFSDRFLRDACLNFILAGRDTSAVALSWFFWLLTRHPHVEDKIVDELQDVVSKREQCSLDPLSYEELRQAVYLHAAINESLRLYPSVPLDTKYCQQDDHFPDGTFVGKGWRVSYNVFAEGRMTQVWGADAEEFKPERWLSESGELKIESPFKFSAFNAGPRLCLGKDMAYLQMKSIASSVLLRYRLKMVPGHNVVQMASLTLMMQHGLAMSVARRV